MSPPHEGAGPSQQGPAPKAASTATNTPKSRRPPGPIPFGTTQQEKVVWMLLSTDGVCSTTFLEEYIPRAAAVIHRLRRDGYIILSRPCTRGHEHASRQIEYVLQVLPYESKGGAA